jgi:plastocyanin
VRLSVKYLLSLLLILQFLNCKKDEDSSVLVNASVANSSEGSVDFGSGDYTVGSSLTFTATPKTGYVFTNWTNTSTNQTYTSNPLSIKVNENTTLVANFEKAAYDVLFNVTGEGSVNKEVVGGGGFTHGSQVRLTAVPTENYSFFYWNNDPGDTENPKTITLEEDKNIAAKFDYEVAKNLVGTWEFEMIDPASKNVTTIKMSIDISLNVLMTTIVNGQVISQIFTHLITLSATAILMGDFAIITDLVVASATSLSMNMISIPEDTDPPTNESEIPDTGKALNLSGSKTQEEPEKDENGIIIAPTEAVTASSTTANIGAVFEESFDQLTSIQSSTLSSDTLETGTSTSTTGAVSYTACSLDATLKAGSSVNQTVASGSSINQVVYDIITDCTRVIHLVSSSGLPSGVSASITGDELKISGTPSGGLGTYNYSVTLDNHLEQTSSAPFVSATVSKVVNGTISVINTGTTTSTNTTDTSTSTNTGTTSNTGDESNSGATSSGTTDTSTSTNTGVTTNTTDTSTSTNTGTTSNTGGGDSTSSGTTSSTSGTSSPTSDNNNCTISSSLTSGSDNQIVVRGNPIETLIYSITSDCNQLNNTNIYGQQLVSGLPPGVTASLSGNTVTISGTPTSQASGTYDYAITIDDSVEATEVSAYVAPTVSDTITGYITVEESTDELVLSTDPSTLNQSVCNDSPITPIVFQLDGSASMASVTGLPEGLNSSIDSNNDLKIEGSFSGNISYPTVYDFTVTSNGSQPDTVNGRITFYPLSEITRTSGDANIVVNSRLDGAEDQLTNTSFSLSFQIANAVGANVTWDDDIITPSVNVSFDGNTGILSISGNPGATETSTHPDFKTYNYTITTVGNESGCSEASITGSIELLDATSSGNSSDTTSSETYEINVTATSATNYILDGSDRNGSVSGNDPSVTINVGDTINFVVNASGHPFYLKTVQGSGTGNQIEGVSNAGTTNGTVSWTPTTAGTYYYQCAPHNSMYGVITVN